MDHAETRPIFGAKGTEQIQPLQKIHHWKLRRWATRIPPETEAERHVKQFVPLIKTPATSLNEEN